MTQTAIPVTPSTIPRYRHWRIQIFAVTWIAYAGFYFTRQAFSVAKLGILEDPILSTHLTKSVMANLDAAYLAAYAVGQFIWGQVSDRFGPRVVILGGLAISAIATVFMGLLPALVFLLPLMIVQGLAQSTGWSPTLSNMAQFFSIGERGRVLGLWSTNYAFGGLVAAPILGWAAYDVFGSWRAAFFSGAAVVAAVFVLVLLFQRNRPQDVGLPPIEEYRAEQDGKEGVQLDDSPEAEAVAEPTPSWRESLKVVLSDRMVRTLGASYFLLKPARYAILLWGPVIVAERLVDGDKFQAVAIPVAFGIAGVVAPILLGRISDRVFSARRVPACVISLGILVAVLALFGPLTATGNPWIMVAVLGLIGLSVYGADAMISCVAAVDFGTSKHAGTAAGLINCCGSVGAILGGLLPGYLSTTTLFYGFAGAALLSMLLLIPHWNRMPAAD
ncbi:MFS transporter [Mycolicibacterium porcinum]|uniref:MFS transporter n=1 Tax=Mycolicibacterium porcinum TaxID=39693 RepID=A0AAP7HDS1_9MYCO|nr:MFS transporter [Mycolicibacterium porcinum]MBX8687401.1 MFS transporter [Mycobacterium sp. 20091114027_K0903767]OCB50127.1 MFS transporter [Mycolicibacterium vulneris]MCV7392253.1 MFS transporter [Mycolicibacterium porcinum]OCB15358.1 MFS transporter [Mycolicibacterium porcinum]ODR26751.1 MFS transporter [Mycolicibacterium porcinum]